MMMIGLTMIEILMMISISITVSVEIVRTMTTIVLMNGYANNEL